MTVGQPATRKLVVPNEGTRATGELKIEISATGFGAKSSLRSTTRVPSV
jgi:hypothetical protein